MKAKTNRWLLITITLCMVIAFAASASAYDVQQRYKNNTGQTAYDLTKILMGDVNVTGAIHDKFANHVVTHPQGTHTVIHWSNGSVNPLESTWACFNVHPGNKANVICALWTDASGNFIGVAGPAVASNVNHSGDSIIVVVTHNWQSWNGTGYPIEAGDGPGSPFGPIDLAEVYYTISNTVLPLDSLNDDFIASATWTPLSNNFLSFGQSVGYNLGVLDPADIVVLRFEATGEGQTSQEMIQFPVRLPVPSLTNWGMLALLVLLVLSAVIVIRKRQRGVLSA